MTLAAQTPATSAGLALRAGRLPFLTASLLPASVGAAMAGDAARPGVAVLGVLAVAMGHLSANLMNDVGDAASGVDALDERYFGFFGGSKLIQRGVVSRRVYVAASLVAAGVSLAAVGVLAWVYGSLLPLGVAAGAVLLAWAYSARPLRLSYHYVGEATVFVLFGPVATLAGYYAASGRAWSPAVLWAAAPMGLMTAGILLANEVPDAAEDARARKRNLVALVGAGRGWLLYAGLVLAAMLVAVWGIWRGMLPAAAWGAAGTVVPAGGAAWILRRHWRDKPQLVRSARWAILAQTWMGLSLLAGTLMR
jgi:1,4-dihydroxy-2-naphthoate octaprenyltransferase